MSLISMEFLLFVLAAVTGYYLIPRRFQWIWLLAFSYIYYVSGGIRVTCFLLFTTVTTYLAGMWIEQASHDAQDKKAEKRRRRQILAGTLVLNFGVLGVLKYTNFVLGTISGMIGGEFEPLNLLLPLGISFYTFQSMGYLLDVYWGRSQAEHNLFRFALFVSFFPQILQGPIGRFGSLGKQLYVPHSFERNKIEGGFLRILWGYFKKMVIADRIALFTATVFSDEGTPGGAILCIAVILSAVQIYSDFSGCMDIAAGVSQMFGIVLEKNFDHPFFAKSASEFWRRWHITLGVWFRDYVYMPLVISPRLIRLSGMAGRKAGKRAGRAVLTVVPLSVVWVLTGLWHGTGASYLVWGVYWGSLIILSTVFAPEIRKMSKILHVDPEKKGWKVFRTIRTFLLFCIGRIITVPGDLHVSGMIFKRILTQPKLWQLVDNTLYEQGLEWKEFALALFAAGILWFVDIQQEKGCVREKIAGWYLPVRCVFYAASIMAVIIFGIYGPDQGGSNFVYIQF